MGRKFFRQKVKKTTSMILTLALLLLAGGCSMNQTGNGENKNVLMAETDSNQAEQGGTLQGSTAQNGVGNSAAADSLTEEQEEFLTEFFTGKMELLEYLIEMYYMDEVSMEDLRTGAYRGMLEALGDPYSTYYTASEYDTLMESTSGTYCGIGAYVSQNMTTMIMTIVKPFVNGPAYAAGMLPGDVIYQVDGEDVTGMELSAVVAKMKGEAGTKVTVTVVRDGVTEPIDLEITRAMIEVQTVEYEMLENRIGYILVSEFDEPTVQQFKDAIGSLKEEGMQALVIDLRDNPGGLLSSVVEMLDYLLPKDSLIVYTEDKYGDREEYRAKAATTFELPLTVLVNGNSASASEIFTGAVKDYGIGTIVGTTTFGKGIVQSVYPLSDGTAVKITVSRYFTPSGVCIHGIGVAPDVEVELAEELRQKVSIAHEEDNQLQTAIQELLKKLK